MSGQQMTEEQKALAGAHLHLARQAVKNHGSVGHEFLDVAYEYLCEAAMKWNGEGTFGGYAALVIRRGLIDHYRQWTQYNRKTGERRVVSMAVITDQEEDSHLLHVEPASDQVSVEDGVVNSIVNGQLIEMLPTTAREVLELMRRSDGTATDAARTLGISQAAVSHRMRTARKMLGHHRVSA